LIKGKRRAEDNEGRGRVKKQTPIYTTCALRSRYNHPELITNKMYASQPASYIFVGQEQDRHTGGGHNTPSRFAGRGKARQRGGEPFRIFAARRFLGSRHVEISGEIQGRARRKRGQSCESCGNPALGTPWMPTPSPSLLKARQPCRLSFCLQRSLFDRFIPSNSPPPAVQVRVKEGTPPRKATSRAP
jgi:hypothetical protein